MKKQISIILIFFYLFLSATIANAHNHPGSACKNERCPVYIININNNCETATDHFSLLINNLQPLEYIQFLKDNPIYFTPPHKSNKRAPPLFSR